MKKKSLLIATPMYGGQCSGYYMNSCLELQRLCDEQGIECEFLMLFNESLVPRARNYCAHYFLKSDHAHMIFIDADIEFQARSVLEMLEYDNDIICGIYPRKTIRWDRVAMAYKEGFLTDESEPQELHAASGDFFLSPGESVKEINSNDPIKVKKAGTGFMMIKKTALEIYAKAHPELNYELDDVMFNNEPVKMTAFFDTCIDPDTKKYLSEDYMFCKYARDAGLEVWACPWIKLGHVGNIKFQGDLFVTLNLANKKYEKNKNLKEEK